MHVTCESKSKHRNFDVGEFRTGSSKHGGSFAKRNRFSQSNYFTDCCNKSADLFRLDNQLCVPALDVNHSARSNRNVD
jgi:hypothetical protein